MSSSFSGDQADGLRRLMSSSAKRRLTLFGSNTHEVAYAAMSLTAALVKQGHNALLFDEHNSAHFTEESKSARLVLIDADLGQQGELSGFAAQSDHFVVVLRANGVCMKDAYLCIKRLHQAHAIDCFRVLVCGVVSPDEAQRVFVNLTQTAKNYLAVDLQSAGFIRANSQSNQNQNQSLYFSTVQDFEGNSFSSDFLEVADRLLQWPLSMATKAVSSLAQRAAKDHKTLSDLALHH